MSLKQQPTVPDVADKWFAPARVPWIIQRSQPVRWMFAPPGVVLVRSKKKVRPLSLPIRPLDQPPPQTNGPRENVVARALPSPKTEGGRNQRKKNFLPDLIELSLSLWLPFSNIPSHVPSCWFIRRAFLCYCCWCCCCCCCCCRGPDEYFLAFSRRTTNEKNR